MEQWNIIKAYDYCYNVTDGTHDSPKQTEFGKYLITSKHIKDNRIDFESAYKISEDDYNKIITRSKVDQWDIIISMIGAYCGFCCIESSKQTDYAIKNVGLLKVGNELKCKWLYYYLTSPHGKQQLSKLRSGSSQPYISLGALRNLDIPVPNENTMSDIVSVLSSLDSKIELNRRINDNLEQQAQSWFVDFEPFRGGEFVDSALGSTPKELPIVYIEDIPHNIESGKRPKGGATFEGVPSIGAENIKGLGYYDYSKTKYIPKEYAQTIKKGKINGYELLIYKDGGKPGYFIPNFSIFGEGFPFNEMYINEHVFILDLMDNAYNAFAYFYMRTPYIMNQLNSIGGKAAIPGINTKDIECLPIYSNESPYVKRYGDIVLPFIKTILSNSLENARLAKMRDTLLPQLMSGELKISE